MENFIVITSGIEDKIEKPHFYVLNKGLNSGKPLLSPCPNCFKVEAANEELKELLYWLSFALWKAKSFHPLLVGSVIPFLRISDYKQIISEHYKVVNLYPLNFLKGVKNLQIIEAKEKQLSQNLKLIQELKRAYALKFLKK